MESFKNCAVDYNKLIVGGINFIDENYKSSIPINDVSLLIDSKNISLWGHDYIKSLIDGYDSEKKSFNNLIQPESFNQSVVDGKDKVYGVGQPGAYLYGGHDSNRVNGVLPKDRKAYCSQQAMLSLIDGAKEDVRLAMQSFSNPETKWYRPVRKWANAGEDFIASVGQALERGVTVSIITSGTEHKGYDTPTEWNDLKDKILDWIKSKLPSAKEQLCRDKLIIHHCNKTKSSKLHSKVIMADKRYVYVGSHNAYWDSHAEFGLIIDSTTFYSKMEKEFWDKISENYQGWNISSQKDDL